MSTMPDYYAVLQVSPDAEPGVIDAAYRRLAAKYHPDVSRDPRATERMTQINAAYEVLSDPDKRAAYDITRRGSPQRQRPPRASTPPGYAGGDWRHWLITMVMVALVIMAGRLGPRVVVPLVALAAVIWLIYKLGRPRK